MHYEGRLIDGSVFDSSYARGETVSFPLGGVIGGWTEGLQLMKPGGKATLTIPAQLGRPFPTLSFDRVNMGTLATRHSFVYLQVRN